MRASVTRAPRSPKVSQGTRVSVNLTKGRDSTGTSPDTCLMSKSMTISTASGFTVNQQSLSHKVCERQRHGIKLAMAFLCLWKGGHVLAFTWT